MLVIVEMNLQMTIDMMKAAVSSTIAVDIVNVVPNADKVHHLEEERSG